MWVTLITTDFPKTDFTVNDLILTIKKKKCTVAFINVSEMIFCKYEPTGKY
jgi:hypothetical protein